MGCGWRMMWGEGRFLMFLYVALFEGWKTQEHFLNCKWWYNGSRESDDSMQWWVNWRGKVLGKIKGHDIRYTFVVTKFSWNKDKSPHWSRRRKWEEEYRLLLLVQGSVITPGMKGKCQKGKKGFEKRKWYEAFPWGM